MRERPTPETDAAIKDSKGQWSFALKETCQRLERERDQAREGQMEALCDCQRLARKIDDIRDVFDHQDEDWTGSITLAKAVSKVIRERDEAHALLDTASDRIEQLNGLCNLLRDERDDAREALKEIKHIFTNGGDTYVDFVKVGNIATDYLEGLWK